MAFSIRNLNVGVRLTSAFAINNMLTLLLACLAFYGLWEMSAQWREFQDVTLAKSATLARGSQALADANVDLKNYIVRGGTYNKSFDEDMGRIERSMADYRALGVTSPEEEKSLNAIADAVKAFRGQTATLSSMKASGASDTELDFATTGADKPVATALQELEKIDKALVSKTSLDISAALASTQQWIAAMTALILALGAMFAHFISRSIANPLKYAVKVTQRVAAGDLTSTIEVNSADETGQVLRALQEMNENLRKIVGDVRSGTVAIGGASAQIASGNEDLSQRTEQQASSLEETASSMEELTSTVLQNAENARKANQLAVGASAVSRKGALAVSEVAGTMSSIEESSKKIVDIISVIDGIAFQTNILALNAAVEAARAGEQGRGFAVVAAEVRTLAQRSAAAAKEIKQLIGDSVAKVESGTRLVDEAGETMGEIASSVKQVTDVMAEIAAASQQQSSGIEEVNQAIAQMDQVTQQNAALVEEAAAAAESLKQQAQNLVHAVAAFKLAEGEAEAIELVQEQQHAVPKSRAAAARRVAAQALPAERRLRVAQDPRRAFAVTHASAAAEKGAGDQWTEL